VPAPPVLRRVSALSLLTLLGGGIGALLHETAWLENTLDVGVAATVSTGLGLVLVRLAHRGRLFRHVRLMDRWAPWVLLCVPVCGLVLALSSRVNRAGAEPDPAPAWTVVSRAHQPPGRRTQAQWKVRLSARGESHWVVVSPAEWNALTVGQPFTSTVWRGTLGLRFVTPPGRDPPRSGR
jgi:hypothetical protein